MEIFAMSRLARLNVKWCGSHNWKSRFNSWGHSNPNYELLMVTEGPVFLIIDGENVELASGEFMLLKPWEEHKGGKRMPEGARFFWIQFSVSPELTEMETEKLSEEQLNEVLMRKQDLRTAEVVDSDALLIPRRFQPLLRYEIFGWIEKLIAEISMPQGYFRFRSTILLMQILQRIADDLLHRYRLNISFPGSFLTYRSIVNFLDEQYLVEVDKGALEERFNFTYEYLSQIFKKYSGISIVTYIHQLRIQKAKHLLLTSAMDVHEIADKVGFQDPFYFSRVFKRMEGATPTQFRHATEENGVPVR